MLMIARPSAGKRDLHIGGVALRQPATARRDTPLALGLNSSRNEWGVEAWGIGEEDDSMDHDGADGIEDQAEDRHPADSHHWIGDTWVGDDWDADAGESLLADAKQALTVVEDYVHARPWKTLAVVALAGIALGFGLARAAKR